MYSDLIIDLAKNPQNKRALETPTLTHSGANVTCGDRVRMYVILAKDGVIEKCTFEGEGCAISIAAASLLTEEVRGKDFFEILKWDSETMFNFLGTTLGPARIKCGLLALDTLQEGLRNR